MLVASLVDEFELVPDPNPSLYIASPSQRKAEGDNSTTLRKIDSSACLFAELLAAAERRWQLPKAIVIGGGGISRKEKKKVEWVWNSFPLNCCIYVPSLQKDIFIMNLTFIISTFLLLSCTITSSFMPTAPTALKVAKGVSKPLPIFAKSLRGLGSSLKARDDFSFSFEVPKKGIADIGTAEVNLPPLLDSSEVIIVRYDLPFGLSAEPSPEQNGEIVVTKDGQPGKEIVGDILRQTTYWGGIDGKEVGIFDVSKNKGNFDKVVQALVTNDLAVSDEIVLVFERPL